MLSRTIRVLICLLLLAAAAPAANREAERAFREGQRLEREGKLREAFEAYKRAAEMEPSDRRFVVSREFARQHAAFLHVNAGVRLLSRQKYTEAARELEQGAEIDPSNDFTRQELERAKEALKVGETRQQSADALPDERALAPPLGLRPRPLARSWDLKGEARTLYLAIGAEYGIQLLFDEGLSSNPVRFRVDDADFSTAIRVLSAITKTFVAPVDERVAMVAPDTPQKRQEFERLVLKNIEVSALALPEQINEVANVLRVIMEMKNVQPSFSRKVITVRDTAGKVDAAERLVRTLGVGRAEVLLEVETMEVNESKARDLGLNVSFQSSAFKLSPLGVVQTGFPAPLPQLLGQAAATAGGSVTTALATFGGGRSLFGITLPSVQFRATLSQSLMRAISTQTIRAADNLSSTLLIGEKYPIINASFSPILFSSAITQQQQAGTLINPFPSFTFEELGVKLRITPRLHNDGEISLRVEAQVRALSGQVSNGVPTISNRETDQIVRVRDGQPTLISGMLSREERVSMSGMPFLAATPVLGYLFGERSQEVTESEIIVVLTPHVLREPPGALAQRQTIPWPSNYVPVIR